MPDTAVTIRTAEEADAAALLSIYAPYVEKTAITFEYEVPTAAWRQPCLRRFTTPTSISI